MLTARPVSVQIIACETPLAIARASAEPRSAIESNTSSMPLTVPIRPSSGESGTSTRSSEQVRGHRAFDARDHRAADLARAPGAVIGARLPRLERLLRLSRAARALKYQVRSITSVHITQAAEEDPDRRRGRLPS